MIRHFAAHIFLLLAIICSCPPLQLCANSFLEPSFDPLINETQPKININNRVLAVVNGKAITTYDVMKKMDITFFRYYPEFASSNVARFQFYQASWKDVLDDLINKELVLADATEHKIEVSNGDVRQEMETLFGPSIIANLHKMGLSYDEAAKIVQGDILINRVISYRVNAKAVRQLTPVRIKEAYQKFSSNPENKVPSEWTYQMISVSGKNKEKTQKMSEAIHGFLEKGEIALNDLSSDKIALFLKEKKMFTQKVKVTVSDTIKSQEQELTDTIKDILSSLNPNSLSKPVLQSKRTTQTIYRIFALKDFKQGGIPSFKSVEETLKEKLIIQLSDQERKHYFAQLKKKHHLSDKELKEWMPDDYKPFSLN